MKVFLSWSGEQSHRVALALKDWMPKVLQALEPWCSSVDIQKGTLWMKEIASNLLDAEAGIICLTPENLERPWIAFEAGVLARHIGDRPVCGYLHGLSEGALAGNPLGQFQLTEASKEDTLKLMETLRSMLPKPPAEPVFRQTFEHFWVELESALKACSGRHETSSRPRRDTDEMLEEILNQLVRLSRVVGQAGRKASLVPLFPDTSEGMVRIAEDKLISILADPTYKPSKYDYSLDWMERMLSDEDFVKQLQKRIEYAKQQVEGESDK